MFYMPILSQMKYNTVFNLKFTPEMYLVSSKITLMTVVTEFKLYFTDCNIMYIFRCLLPNERIPRAATHLNLFCCIYPRTADTYYINLSVH